MKKPQIIALAAALAVGSSASAQVSLELVSVGGVGNNNYQTVTLDAVTSPGGSTIVDQGGVEAGVYNLSVNGVATPAFCIDIATDQTEGKIYPDYSYTPLVSSPVDSVGPMGATAAADIEKLWAAYFSPTMSSDQAAALQVAIWQVEAENSGGNSAGAYTLTVSGFSDSTFQTDYNNMLAALPGLTTEADLIALTDSGQAYVVAVPETGTIVAAALLLLPLGASMLRIVQKNRMV